MIVSGIIKPAKIASTSTKPQPATASLVDNNEFHYIVYEKVQICGSISELNCTSFNHKRYCALRVLLALPICSNGSDKIEVESQKYRVSKLIWVNREHGLFFKTSDHLILSKAKTAQAAWTTC